jgi:hypothetical protein
MKQIVLAIFLMLILSPLALASPPEGTGEVLEKELQETKEFYTIQAADGTVFYLVVDLKKDDVFFLSQVKLEELGALVPAFALPTILESSSEDAETPPKGRPWLMPLILACAALGAFLLIRSRRKKKRGTIEVDE